MKKIHFIDPIKPENILRLLKYISDAFEQDVSSVRKCRPAAGGIENRNYYVAVTADGVDCDFVLR